jgi:prevent-host-death family protein
MPSLYRQNITTRGTRPDQICVGLEVIVRSITEAKGQLSSLVQAVLNGEEVILDRAGVPVVRLVPFADPAVKRQPGTLKVTMSEDFDSEDPELNKLFYEGS